MKKTFLIMCAMISFYQCLGMEIDQTKENDNHFIQEIDNHPISIITNSKLSLADKEKELTKLKVKKNNADKNNGLAIIKILKKDHPSNEIISLDGIIDRDKNNIFHIFSRKNDYAPLISWSILNFRSNLDAENANGLTPMMIAIQHNKKKALLALHEAGCSVNHKTSTGKTPLLWAVKSNRTVIVKMLFDVGVDATIADDEGVTPLHEAQTPEICEILIKNKAEINAQDKNHQTPTHYAVKTANIPKIECLLKHNPDQSLKDKDGNTCNDLIPAMGAILLRRGACEYNVK